MYPNMDEIKYPNIDKIREEIYLFLWKEGDNKQKMTDLINDLENEYKIALNRIRKMTEEIDKMTAEITNKID